jgi:drug/metabolite transporter (DMT)-like permease
MDQKASISINEQPTSIPVLSYSAIIGAVLLCFVFGANTVAIKISLSGLGAFTTAGLRFGIAGLIILIWAVVTHQPIKVSKKQLPHLLLLAIIFFVQLTCFYQGLSRTNASRGTLLANIQPFFVLFLAHFLIPGDRINTRKLVGIILAFSGVALVFLTKAGTTSDLRIGDLIMLSAAFVWACSGVYSKRLLKDLQPFQVVLYQTLVSTPIFLTVAVVSGETMIIRLDPDIILAMFYQCVITTAFGFVAWNILLKKYGAVAIHSFIFIMPIAGVLLGGLVLKETISLNILGALLLIVAGILVVNSKPKKTIAVVVHPGRNL